jgi:protein involved in polysaccharide export with SLBB domain
MMMMMMMMIMMMMIMSNSRESKNNNNNSNCCSYRSIDDSNNDNSAADDDEGNNIISSEISNEFKSTESSDALINRQVKLTLPYSDHMTVEDLILKAGGLRESAATGYVEIVRRKKNIGFDNPKLINSQIAEIIKFGISNNLQLDNTASKFELVPFDEVFIRTSPNYELQQFVTVQGQVIIPGVFGLERKDERLSDIVRRAGGLNNQAFPEGAKLIRKNHLTEAEKIRKIDQLNEISDNFSGAIIQNKETYNKEKAALKQFLEKPEIAKYIKKKTVDKVNPYTISSIEDDIK